MLTTQHPAPIQKATSEEVSLTAVHVEPVCIDLKEDSFVRKGSFLPDEEGRLIRIRSAPPTNQAGSASWVLADAIAASLSHGARPSTEAVPELLRVDPVAPATVNSPAVNSAAVSSTAVDSPAVSSTTVDSGTAKRTATPPQVEKPETSAPVVANLNDVEETASPLSAETATMDAQQASAINALQAESGQLPPPSSAPRLLGKTPADKAESVKDEFKPMAGMRVNIAPSDGDLPQNFGAARFAKEQRVDHVTGFSRYQPTVMFNWEAPAMGHQPLYFEEVNLERHGYQVPLIQPVVSAAHFFSRVPIVPYLSASQKQRLVNYTLGHYRPGSYAPYYWYYPNPSLDGAALEAILAVGVVWVFP